MGVKTTDLQCQIETPSLLDVPAKSTHTATVIFLHSLGQATETWRQLIVEALAPELPHVHWILPHASRQPVTMNPYQKLPSWFNVSRLPPVLEEFDAAGIAASMERIEDIILSVVHSGVDPTRIVLWGSGQGAAMAMLLALTTLNELGGVVGMSGWIPSSVEVQAQIHGIPDFPVLWCHGAKDLDVPIAYGHAATNFLTEIIGMPDRQITFKAYPKMGHSINDALLADVILWLQAVVPL